MNPLIPIALALTFLQGPPSRSPRVADDARLFSESAVARANDSLGAIARATGWEVEIKTVDSLGGRPIKEETTSLAKAAKPHGLFLLFSKGDKKFYALPATSAATAFPPEGIKAITDAINAAFRAGKFDEGLDAAVAQIRTLAAATPSLHDPVGVRDRAKLFSPDSVIRADTALRDFQRETKWQVAILTIDSLGGKDIKARAEADAASSKVQGLFVLIAKKEHQIEIVPSSNARQAFKKAEIDSIVATLKGDFKAEKYDQGLLDAVAQIRRVGGSGGSSRQADSSDRIPTSPGSKVATASSPPPPTSGTAKIPAPGTNNPSSDLPRTETGRTLPETTKNLANNNLMMYLAIGAGALLLLWILSRAFRPSGTSASPNEYATGQPGPQSPAPGYGPAPTNAPPPGYRPGPTNSPPAGYGPGQRPAPPPGYGPQNPPPGYGGQPGYGPPPGYAPGGYAAPPPQPAAGGGFISGALGGLGGAVVGNILYDKFGRPHENQGGGHVEGHAPTSAGHDAPLPPTYHPDQVESPRETYDADAGAGGSWDAPAPASSTPADEWSGQGEAGAGGDWGQPEPAADPGAGAWGNPAEDPGAGSWGSPVEEASGGGGDWGAPAAEEPPASDWSGGQSDDSGGGGDWGGGAPESDQGQGGGW